MKYRILDSNSLILLTGSCILSIAENINMRCDDMKSPGKRIKTEKTSVVTSHVSINAGGVVVKVVSGKKESAETATNKRIAKRATSIARTKAFQRFLPISVCRNGKIREIFADEDVK
ncbi:MAG: hypothetical protein ACI4UV_15695 [Victivallales bacterium]